MEEVDKKHKETGDVKKNMNSTEKENRELSEDIKQLLTEARTLVSEKTELRITNKEEKAVAEVKLKYVRGMIKNLESKRDEHTKELREAIESAKSSLVKQNKIFDPYINELKMYDYTLIEGAKRFQLCWERREREIQERERKRRIGEQEKRRKELEDKEREEESRIKQLEQEIAHKEETGATENDMKLKVEKDLTIGKLEEIKIEKEMIQEEITKELPIYTRLPSEKGIAYIDTYDISIEDIHQVPNELKICDVDWSQLKKIAKETNGEAQIPGIKITRDKIVRVRT